MPSSIVENIDCMVGMARYPDKYFDLAIVDPPYGIGMGGSLNVNSKTNFIPKKWDTEIPTDEYFKELFRVSKNQIVWGANYFPYLWGNGCKGFIHWDKMNHHYNRADGELAWTSFDKPSMNFRYMWDGNRYGFEGKVNGVGKPTIRIHPTEKPISLYKWLLENYAYCKYCRNEGGSYEDVVGDGGSRMWIECEECGSWENKPFRILDTHLGSGSSRIAAHDMGFDFTGFELDKDYFQAAEKRYQNHIKQLKIF